MFLNLKLLIIAALLVPLLTFGSYKAGTWIGNRDGRAACIAEHKAAQAEHSKKVKKRYDKIDKETPFNRDKSAVIEWLRHFTVREQ